MTAQAPAASIRIWLILFTSIILTALGQIFLKLGAINLSSWGQLGDNLLHGQLTHKEQDLLLWFSLGVGCYIASMLVWIYVLSFLKLSRAYPLLSMAYVLVYLAAVLLPALGERFSMEKNIGILIIMIGVFIVSLPSKSK